jgi:hypothetical protein
MFHNNATPWCIYITADKLRLNKLLHVSTHAFCIRLMSRQCLKIELCASIGCLSSLLVPNQFKLTHALVEKCRVILVTVQVGLGSTPPPPPPDTIFRSSWERDWVVGADWLQSVHHGWNKTPPCHEFASFCCVKLAEMSLEINLRELTVLFERCILET